jgi:small-conductance mechanosensitive channel
MATYEDILNLIDNRVKTVEELLTLKENDNKVLKNQLEQYRNLYYNAANERKELLKALDLACQLLKTLGYKPAEEDTWQIHFYKMVDLDTSYLKK